MEKEPQYWLQAKLGEVTRKERRTLLGVAIIGIIIVQERVRLSGISMLGLTLKDIPEYRLLLWLGLVVSYFMVAFLVHVISDAISWRFAVADACSQKEEERYHHELEQQRRWQEERLNQDDKRSACLPTSESLEERKRDIDRQQVVKVAKGKRESYYPWAFTVFLLRTVFDVGLPLIVGGYSIWFLMSS